MGLWGTVGIYSVEAVAIPFGELYLFQCFEYSRMGTLLLGDAIGRGRNVVSLSGGNSVFRPVLSLAANLVLEHRRTCRIATVAEIESHIFPRCARLCAYFFVLLHTEFSNHVCCLATTDTY